MLTRYFERPQLERFNDLTYTQYFEAVILTKSNAANPAHARITAGALRDAEFWLDGCGLWVYGRQRGDVLYSIADVPRSKADLHFVRLLLVHVPARSHDDLRLVDGILRDTYADAAVALGLVESEHDHRFVMEENLRRRTPLQLRRLAVTLGLNGGNLADIWERYAEALSADYADGRRPPITGNPRNDALLEISEALERSGTSCIDHGLPEPHGATDPIERERGRWFDKSALQAEIDAFKGSATGDQLRAFAQFVEELDADHKGDEPVRLACIEGVAGAGKTALSKMIMAYERLQGRLAFAVASTGLAATHYPHGMTAHKALGLPVGDLYRGHKTTPRSHLGKQIGTSTLFVWDEIGCTTVETFEKAIVGLKDLVRARGSSGMLVVLVGDCRQLAPVVVGGTVAQVLGASLYASDYYTQMRVSANLTQTQRARLDPHLAKACLAVGEDRFPRGPGGLVSLETFVRDERDTGDGFWPPNFTTDPDELIKRIILANGGDPNAPETMLSRAILCTTNRAVDTYNSKVVSLIRAPERAIYSTNYMVAQSRSRHHEVLNLEDRLRGLKAANVPPHKLVLKVGMVCRIVINVDVDAGLANGTKCIVMDVGHFCVTVDIIDPNAPPGARRRQEVLPRVSFKIRAPWGGVAVRNQIPLKYAYAYTMHRSQSMTLDYVGIDLVGRIFAHGQLNVALSRGKKRSNYYFLVDPADIIDGMPHVGNEVIRRLLKNLDVDFAAVYADPRPKLPEPEGFVDYMCEGCGLLDAVHAESGAMLVCEDCRRGFHQRCADPPVYPIPPPAEAYFCSECRSARGAGARAAAYAPAHRENVPATEQATRSHRASMAQGASWDQDPETGDDESDSAIVADEDSDRPPSSAESAGDDTSSFGSFNDEDSEHGSWGDDYCDDEVYAHFAGHADSSGGDDGDEASTASASSWETDDRDDADDADDAEAHGEAENGTPRGMPLPLAAHELRAVRAVLYGPNNSVGINGRLYQHDRFADLRPNGMVENFVIGRFFSLLSKRSVSEWGSVGPAPEDHFYSPELYTWVSDSPRMLAFKIRSSFINLSQPGFTSSGSSANVTQASLHIFPLYR